MSHHTHEIALASREVEGVDLAAGEVLAAVDGALWITTANDGRDMILMPGEVIQFPRKTRAIVGGLRERAVRLRIEHAAA